MSVDETGGANSAIPYRVLARKYRPASFADLIGQEAMVRTLSNAFDSGRIHQAYLLSGVRGVGKTTTARIVARALNYHRPARDALALVDRPTIAMDEIGSHCQAIIESRHVDVIEMDAASHTGIDDIRELIEGARYRPVMARTKVYIIDEVHMLSKAAFNGLLKTLEEPPEHVKFLFATTEADKVPVTVRSRCQRFDLRRIEPPVMVAHLAGICAREGVAVTPDALSLIARAAEGSVRDALSLLDQALATGLGASASIGEDDIRAMLGLADRARVIDLFEQVMRGEIAAALTGLKALYDQGADPLSTITDLADFVHLVTRLKLVPDAAKDPGLTGEERARGAAFAGALGLPVLTRAWQMLLKGLGDIKDSPRSLAAAEMVLVRLAFAADLPTPDEAIRQLGAPNAGSSPSGISTSPILPAGSGPVSVRGAFAASPLARPALAVAPQADAAPLPRLRGFADVVALAAANRDITLKVALERDVRLVRFEEGSIEFEAAAGASPTLAATLMKKLAEWTGTRWMVAVAATGGTASLKEQAVSAAEAERTTVAADPLVAQVLTLFPGSVLTVKAIEAEGPPEPEPELPVGEADEFGYDDDLTDDDL
ncbi:DNA polymerase III subunit gamma/tau [Lichenihabitans sp. Uapishka_5]|uniref:DNA polymerase III subunit gamma/tau n=1 Tax=Lichenihabitans sp. Uapishka_5 TaxID=3037302 RepID=UPI0029E8065A|nr:DNA polymerase III subunit gamma/tau [Lichenihabitans sp. Uapishka_5]MDX7949780.1 DNA polymerase III subunit gamma/tau [Lichenihabitans sp. Uapishka_5]